MARLDLRPNCECCDKDLPPQSTDAFICSYECTYCRSCVEEILHGVCPNCHGNLVQRPVRPEHGPAGGLARHPASAVRVRAETPCTPPLHDHP